VKRSEGLVASLDHVDAIAELLDGFFENKRLNRVAVGDQDALGHDADSIQLRETLQCGRTAAQRLRAGSKEGCSCAKTVQRKGKYPPNGCLEEEPETLRQTNRLGGK
jgi:hypothetical protein